MKTITVSLLMILLLSSFSFSQKKNENLLNTSKKFSVELTAGPSFPYSDFGRKDVSQESSGYAKLGYKFELSAAYRLIDVLDITVMGFYNSNGSDLSNLSSFLNQKYPGSNWIADSKRWNLLGGFAGFQLDFPITKKITGGFKAYSGFINTKSPEAILRNGNDFFKQSELSTTSFGYFVSLSANYPLTKSLFWTVSGDFIGSNASFNDVKTTTFINGATNEKTISYSQNIQVFVIDTGIKFIF